MVLSDILNVFPKVEGGSKAKSARINSFYVFTSRLLCQLHR